MDPQTEREIECVVPYPRKLKEIIGLINCSYEKENEKGAMKKINELLDEEESIVQLLAIWRVAEKEHGGLFQSLVEAKIQERISELSSKELEEALSPQSKEVELSKEGGIYMDDSNLLYHLLLFSLLFGDEHLPGFLREVFRKLKDRMVEEVDLSAGTNK